MEITEVETLPYHFPIDKAWDEKPSWYRDWHNAALGWDRTVEARQECVVRIHTDEGITGIGAADKAHKDARIVESVIEQLLAPTLIGEDPTDIERLWQEMWRTCGPNIGGAKGIGHGAISGINVACWDILGKKAGLPIYKLLGGDEDIPLTPYIGTFTHGWRRTDDLDSIVEEARFYVDKGFKAIKFRGGRGPPDSADLETIKALRAEFSPNELTLMIDINGGYSRQQALEMAKKFNEYDLFWIEDPFVARDHTKYAEFQEKVDINVFVGAGPTTMEMTRMINSGATTNIASISCEHSGGISEAMKVATLIHTFDLKVAAIAHEPMGSLPTFHVWKAAPPGITDGSYVEYDPMNAPWDRLLTNPPEFKDGELVLSDEPGLGTDINEDFIEDHPLPDEPNPTGIR